MAGWIRVHFPAFWGVLRLEAVRFLCPGEGPSWEAWARHGRTEVVKAAANRVVARARLDGQTFYLKVFPTRNWRDAVKRLFRGDPARREFHRLLWLERCGIASAEAVGWGTVRDAPFGPGSVLITADVGRTLPLSRYADMKGPTRRQHIEAVAQFVAGLHRAGMYHGDLHAENLLVRTDSEGCARPFDSSDLVVIDLGRALRASHAGWAAARADLAILYSAWNGRLARSERLRFLLAYRRARPGLTMPSVVRAAREIELAGWATARRVARRLDRRALRTGEGFVRKSDGPFEVYTAADNAAAASIPLPPSVRSRTACGLRAWQFGHALALRGIPVVRPRMLVRRRRWLGWAEWLFTDDVPHTVPLDRVIARNGHESSQVHHRRMAELAASAGTLLGLLHRWHFRAGGMKPQDLLACWREDRWGWMIAHPESVGQGVRTQRQRCRDLARWLTGMGLAAAFSRIDLLRLLRAYFAQWPAEDRALHRFWVEINKRGRPR